SYQENRFYFFVPSRHFFTIEQTRSTALEVMQMAENLCRCVSHSLCRLRRPATAYDLFSSAREFYGSRAIRRLAESDALDRSHWRANWLEKNVSHPTLARS